jgi:hypothetical protein
MEPTVCFASAELQILLQAGARAQSSMGAFLPTETDRPPGSTLATLTTLSFSRFTTTTISSDRRSSCTREDDRRSQQVARGRTACDRRSPSLRTLVCVHDGTARLGARDPFKAKTTGKLPRHLHRVPLYFAPHSPALRCPTPPVAPRSRYAPQTLLTGCAVSRARLYASSTRHRTRKVHCRNSRQTHIRPHCVNSDETA